MSQKSTRSKYQESIPLEEEEEHDGGRLHDAMKSALDDHPSDFHEFPRSQTLRNDIASKRSEIRSRNLF